jgi:tRNA G18 (ribose-2'-O)-methylase SpoU
LRKKEELVLVEGVRAVKEAIDAGAEVRFVVVSERIESTTAGLELAEHIRKENLDITSVSEKCKAVDPPTRVFHHNDLSEVLPVARKHGVYQLF